MKMNWKERILENIYDPTPRRPKPRVIAGSVRSTLRGRAREIWDKAQAAKEKKKEEVTEAEAATMGQLFAPEEAAKKERMAAFIARFGKGTRVEPVKRKPKPKPGWAIRRPSRS